MDIFLLGDASLLSIVVTIQLLLYVLEEILQQQWMRQRQKSSLLNGYIKCKRHSLISLCHEYGNLFEHVYRMDYS